MTFPEILITLDGGTQFFFDLSSFKLKCASVKSRSHLTYN